MKKDRQILYFSKDWSKLNERLISTLRKRCKYEEGEEVIIHSPSHNFIAKILQIVNVDLNTFPEPLLCYDTDTKNKSDALKVIQSFYRNDILECDFHFILLEKITITKVGKNE